MDADQHARTHARYTKPGLQAPHGHVPLRPAAPCAVVGIDRGPEADAK